MELDLFGLSSFLLVVFFKLPLLFDVPCHDHFRFLDSVLVSSVKQCRKVRALVLQLGQFLPNALVNGVPGFHCLDQAVNLLLADSTTAKFRPEMSVENRAS